MRDSIGLVGIATPIGAGDLHQLERRADLAGRGHMRTAAEIEPLALPVDFQILVAGIASTSSTLNSSPCSSNQAFA